jgi:hypothetical protein
MGNGEWGMGNLLFVICGALSVVEGLFVICYLLFAVP